MNSRIAAAIACVLIATSAQAQTATVASTRPDTAADLDNATLRPGDVLRLRIWMEPDWSGDYPVDEHGMAVLPRLGDTRVIDVPADQLRRQLTDRYRQYLNNPSIEITPLRRVAIVGAVRNPGVYRVEPSVTLGGVVNVAGGQTPQAKHSIVELRRAGGHRTIDLQKHPELASLQLASDDQIYVPERSWLSQNATWFVSTIVGIVGTAAYLIAR